MYRPFALVALLAFGAFACDGWPGSEGSGNNSLAGGGGLAPVSPAVIDEVDLPETAQIVSDQYQIPATITFHDDSGTVSSIRVYIPVIAKTLNYNAGGVASAAGYGFEIDVSADVPLGGAGATTFEFSLVDGDGGVSEPVVKTVSLQ